MTINKLLLNTHYRGNQTLLAKDLKINRGTLRKFMADEEGEHHFIKLNNEDVPELFTNQSNKV